MPFIQKAIVLLALLVSGCGCPALWAQLTAKYTTHDPFFKVGYLEYLPSDYFTTTNNYPVIIYLHGGDEGGDGTPESLEKVKSWGPPSLIQGGVDMCFTVNETRECFIVLSPQKPASYGWSYIVHQLIENMLNGPDAYRIDPERIYLTGLSRGGMGAYEFAGSDFNNPNKVAAIAPMSAWLDGEGCTIAERKISVWAFHGSKDTLVPYGAGLSAFNSIRNCLPPGSDVDMRFTTYEDRYHDAWIPGYNDTHAYHTPNLYEWLLMQKRAVAEPDPITSTQQDLPDDVPEFSIHPNPAWDNITFSYSGAVFPDKINIWTVTGDLVRSVDNISSQIDISALSGGVYIIQMETHSGLTARKRFIKK